MNKPITSRARVLVAGFAAVLFSLIVLATAFEAGVQSVDAAGLVVVKDDAKEFFTADYVFIILYAVLFPVALWRYTTALDASRLRRRTKWSAVLFVAAGIADAVENALLLSATDEVSKSTVDAAHLVAIPKIILFVAAAMLALFALWHAVDDLRAPSAPASG